MPTNDPDHPVLIVAPIGNDSAALAELLNAENIHACIRDDLGQCAESIIAAHIAALLVTEEALLHEQLPSLLAALKTQPEWSELPIIILAGEGEARLLELTAIAPGAVTLLERPMHSGTVLTAVRVALRSRCRQYLVRDLLDDQRRSMLERQQRAEQLQQALDQRTREVTQAQQSLAAVQRMAAVGTFASGLTHDLSNVLLPLSARLDVVLTDSRLTGEHRTDLNVVVALVEHLRQMAGDLALFSRDPEDEGVEGFTVLAHWMRRVHDLMESSVVESRRGGPHITLQWDVPDELPAIGIAPHRLTQAILNLVHNARDAILAKHQGTDAAKANGLIIIQARTAENASAVIIKVSDDGIGMNDEVKRRCIEPFYTTKDRPTTVGEGPSVTSGSGIGLTLAHSIAQRIGGELRIHSQFGEGTTIELQAPVVTQLPLTGPVTNNRRVSAAESSRFRRPRQSGGESDNDRSSRSTESRFG